MAGLTEQFGASLVRVIKKVRRRSPDGGTQLVKQAFHVKKANPNDEYAAKAKSSIQPLSMSKGKPGVPMLGSAGPVQGDAPQPEVAQPLPTRMAVRYYDIAWIDKKTKSSVEKADPIPSHLRKRYDKGNRALQVIDPGPLNIAIGSVLPTDRVLWGVDEPNLLNDLRSGTVRKMRVVKPGCGSMLARIESHMGGSFSAYLWLESLRDPIVKSIWGDLVNIEDGGALSIRAASAYEVAKSCGLDDVIPPTVSRYDDSGDLTSVLPDSLIEKREILVDWVAQQTGDDPDNVRRRLGGHATVQFVRDELWTVDREDWFKSIFKDSGSEDKSDSLNRIWEVMPPNRRISFLRLAAFDFVVWNLDRSLGDIAFCDNEKHPVIAYGNEMSLPCPSLLGKRYAESGIGAYGDVVADSMSGKALMWNDIMTMLVVRGGDDEIRVFEDIGHDIASRMRGDRSKELARSLIDRKLNPLQICGALSRIWMLATHSADIAKDPYFAARYYAQILNGDVPDEMSGIEEYVDQTMQNSLNGDFSFFSKMKSEHKDDKRS